jgi:hypothetical protein
VYAIQAVFRSYGGVEGRSVTDAPGGSKLALAVYSALNAEATDYLAPHRLETFAPRNDWFVDQAGIDLSRRRDEREDESGAQRPRHLV